MTSASPDAGVPRGRVLDVALTPAGLRPADVVVVIDVLRATTTVAWALGAGYRQVHCAASLDAARTLAGPGRVLAGERDCRAPEDFDQGNSPREATDRRGHELILASTNGTPAIVAATRHAPIVITAALANLEAVAQALIEDAPPDATILFVCAGTHGALALEDVYVAGRLCERLGGAQTDAAKVAAALARHHPDPRSALTAAAHADVLRRAGLESDLADCALESTLAVVPHVTAVHADCAALTDAGADALGPPLTPASRRRPESVHSSVAREAADAILSHGGWCVLESCLDVPEQLWSAQLLSFERDAGAVAELVVEESAARPHRDLRLTGCDRRTLAPQPDMGAHLCYVAHPRAPALESAGG